MTSKGLVMQSHMVLRILHYTGSGGCFTAVAFCAIWP